MLKGWREGTRKRDRSAHRSCGAWGWGHGAEPGNPQEVEGVLIPAAARRPDGALYLFHDSSPGQYPHWHRQSPVDAAGDLSGVERLGIALEPEADYERRSDGGGGCEDPRITFVEPLQCT